MCGILIYSKTFSDLFNETKKEETRNKSSDYYVKRRGPDDCNELVVDDLVFRHYHLKISENPLKQPLIQGDLTVLFNGEIYNSIENNLKDGANIIPAIMRDDERFTTLLDGEFAIAAYQSQKKIVTLATDPFGTKPLYFSMNNDGIIISSYASAIIMCNMKPRRVASNTLIKIDYHNKIIQCVKHNDIWQKTKKTSLDEWCHYFDESMNKRIVSTNKEIYFGLSGGYDSGIISCYLAKKEAKSRAISVLNKDELYTQLERLRYFKDVNLLSWSNEMEKAAKSYALKNIEELQCIEYSTGSNYYSNKPMIEDSGFKKLIHVAAIGERNGCKVFIDGMGGDEIYSDYGWNGKRLGIHSNFGGLFPNDIFTIIPKNPYNKRARWASFYNSTMQTYLSKSEHVIGSFGHESRYPLLDKKLVNTFINLPAEVKNENYKAPLGYYMEKYDWPMMKEVKHGF